ncbi:hypothetical protein EXM22_10640 [Oceanispirochaeta crateris]|uniref:FecR protein domain-containing protein n=1 Tax=Oceanispirochaeta crateris TaxID=2518645 RepID=A0A5C1QMI1_9SPIO|nr:FecR family protein [Oceanispirochaeta crateris]QEN08419.1 hypothetical protein EXM22_10640 [Oceanispirochaeta crateris]
MKVQYLILLMPLFFMMSCLEEKQKVSPPQSVTGKIIGMEGDVKLEGKIVETGDSVPDGSVITTSLDGYCEIQFLGSNIIKIYEDSILRISFTDSTISLDRGAAAAVLRNIGTLIQNMDDVFTIQSGTVVAGIRGTSFYMQREDADTSYFCLCNGEIDLSDSNGKFSQPMKNIHHGAVRISEKDNQIEVSRAPMLYHTDSDMEALASRIGEKMDWTHVESSH